jgi:hypothetical protein
MSLQRPEEVDEEIASLPPPATTECREYLRACGGRLKPETLVHVMRAAAQQDCTEIVELAGQLLTGLRGDGRIEGGHCEAIIRAVARKGGIDLDPALFQDFRQHCYRDMLKQIRAGASAQPIWEQRFAFVFKRRVLDVAKSIKVDKKWQAEHDSIDEPDATELADRAPPLDDRVIGGLQRDTLLRAIRRLPDKQRQAAYLAWCEDRPVQGDDESCVTRIMGISDRAVRKLLEKAALKLQADPEVQAVYRDILGNG